MSTPQEKHNRYPSTARLNDKGEYLPDKLNQPLAFANTSAHDLGQLKHSTPRQGYCVKHIRLGCTECPPDND